MNALKKCFVVLIVLFLSFGVRINGMAEEAEPSQSANETEATTENEIEKKDNSIICNDLAFSASLKLQKKNLNAKASCSAPLSYVSSNTSVKVDQNGNVSVQNWSGTAVITIKAAETATTKAAEKQVSVTVKKIDNTITMKSQRGYSNRLKSQTFNFKPTSLDPASEFSFSCSDSRIRVSSAGVATVPAGYYGTCTITVKVTGSKVYKGKSKSVKLIIPKVMNILMIGNSITRYDKNPKLWKYLSNMLKVKGYNPSVTVLANNGYSLCRWLKNYKTYLLNTINSKNWAYVILQENTDWQIARTSSYTEWISHYAHKHFAGTKVIIRATWAYNYTRYSYGTSNSYATQQTKIDNKALQVAIHGFEKISWEGDAFKLAKNSFSTSSLWVPDGNHPTSMGQYLASATLYETITGDSAENINTNEGIASSSAKLLRSYAHKAALKN